MVAGILALQEMVSYTQKENKNMETWIYTNTWEAPAMLNTWENIKDVSLVGNLLCALMSRTKGMTTIVQRTVGENGNIGLQCV